MRYKLNYAMIGMWLLGVFIDEGYTEDTLGEFGGVVIITPYITSS